MCCAVIEIEEVEMRPDCGAAVDADGDAGGCSYSPVICDTCGYSPCDWSC